MPVIHVLSEMQALTAYIGVRNRESSMRQEGSDLPQFCPKDSHTDKWLSRFSHLPQCRGSQSEREVFRGPARHLVRQARLMKARRYKR